MAIAQNYRAFTPEIWSPIVNTELEKNLVAANVFNDRSDELTAGGDSLWIPDVTSNDMSATDIATTSGEIDGQSISDTKTQLQVDKWKGVAQRFTDYQMAQVAKSYNLKRDYAMRQGYKLADTFDAALLGEYTNLSPRVGGSATNISASNLEEGLRIITSHSVPKNECTLLLSPKAYWSGVMSNQKLYDASQFGKPSLPQGAHDVLYGIPVAITQNIQTSASSSVNMDMNMLVHGSSVVYATGALPGGMTDGKKVRIQEKEAEHLRTKLVSDIMYGVKTLNSKRGVVIRSKA